MRRVMVIGCSGAGKSTFAMRLSAATGLPYVSLDALFWQPDWREPDREHWRKVAHAVVETDSWIIDGGYFGTAAPRLARADTVMWFDMPRRVCLAGIMRRVITSYGQTRPEMAPGCPERLNWAFLRYVWTFDRQQRPKILALVERLSPAQRLVRFRARRQANSFLAALPEASARAA